MKRKPCFSFTLVLLLSVFIVCVPAQAAPSQIIIGNLSDPLYLEPNASQFGSAESRVCNQILEGLVTNNEDSTELVPMLATDWTISEDGLTYTFNLKPGVKFSNGDPVTGEDWIWSLYRARDTATSNFRGLAEPIDTIEAPSDTQLVIHLKAPYPAFLAALANFNMVLGNKKHHDEIGEEAYLMSPLGTGPYMLKEWRKEEYVLIEKNPYYHGTPGFVDEIKYQVVADDNTRLMQLQSGQIDVAGDIPFTMVEQFRAVPGLVLDIFPSTQIRYVSLNTTKEPFDDVRVRRAIYTGINRAEIAEVVVGDFGYPAASTVSASQGKFHNPGIPLDAYDPEMTKKALTDAGYTLPIPFTLTVSSSSALYEQIAVLMQSHLNNAGFDVTIESLENATVSDMYQELGHQAVLMQWFDDILDPSALTQFMVNDRPSEQGGTNAYYTGLKDEALFQLDAAASRELDDAKRVQMYHEIQQRVYDNANLIPIFGNSFAHAHTDKISGLNVSPMNVYRVQYLQKAE